MSAGVSVIGSTLDLRIWLLAFGTFAIGSDVFVVPGILPNIAHDLDVSLDAAGQVVSVAGEVLTCEASVLKDAALQSVTLLSVLIRHEQTMFAQAQQSAACMANHDVEARLCRWLLRARDLARSDTLLFTQEYLAEMLGVRRISVNVVAHTLQRAGLIKYARGKIQFLNVEGVQDSACECYKTVRSHYDQLLGHDRRPSS
jgi:hypothetical protein